MNHGAIIVLSGPEKVGKTTLAKEIELRATASDLKVNYRHFSGKTPVTRGDLINLREMSFLWDVTIWDRSWACAQVYQDAGAFKQLPSAIGAGAEVYVQQWLRKQGITAMLIGNPETLDSRRTPDDLSISPFIENLAYEVYAKAYGWDILRIAPGKANIKQAAAELLDAAIALADTANIHNSSERLSNLFYGFDGPLPLELMAEDYRRVAQWASKVDVYDVNEARKLYVADLAANNV